MHQHNQFMKSGHNSSDVTPTDASKPMPHGVPIFNGFQNNPLKSGKLGATGIGMNYVGGIGIQQQQPFQNFKQPQAVSVPQRSSSAKKKDPFAESPFRKQGTGSAKKQSHQ